MVSSSKSFRHSLPPVLLVISLFGLYLSLMAPGLTWANEGSDGGDLITAAATGGVAHPSGYPLYLLLARLFQSLPVGSLAYRTNLMSACFTALGVGLVYAVATAFLSPSAPAPAWSAGLAAGLAFGVAPLVWEPLPTTVVDGIACAPAQTSGAYALIGK